MLKSKQLHIRIYKSMFILLAPMLRSPQTWDEGEGHTEKNSILCLTGVTKMEALWLAIVTGIWLVDFCYRPEPEPATSPQPPSKEESKKKGSKSGKGSSAKTKKK